MIRQRQPELLDMWLTDCSHSVGSHTAVCHLTQQDYAAVKAALELPWSNGQTEGQIHRLKLLKRQMYGVLTSICCAYGCATWA